MEAKAQQEIIHVFVKKGTQPEVKLEFTTDHATGLEIKTCAGGGAQDGLYVKGDDGAVREIDDNQTVHLKNGMHFSLVPNGRVS